MALPEGVEAISVTPSAGEGLWGHTYTNEISLWTSSSREMHEKKLHSLLHKNTGVFFYIDDDIKNKA